MVRLMEERGERERREGRRRRKEGGKRRKKRTEGRKEGRKETQGKRASICDCGPMVCSRLVRSLSLARADHARMQTSRQTSSLLFPLPASSTPMHHPRWPLPWPWPCPRARTTHPPCSAHRSSVLARTKTRQKGDEMRWLVAQWEQTQSRTRTHAWGHHPYIPSHPLSANGIPCCLLPSFPRGEGEGAWSDRKNKGKKMGVSAP